MAYTVPVLVAYNLRCGYATRVTGVMTTTGEQTPFQLLPFSGNYWGQVTFQAVIGSVTTLVASLELDMSGDDSNFVTSPISGYDFVNSTPLIVNLNGGNIRYRWNATSFTDGGATGAYILAIAG